jgi:hypothetical protein
MSDGVWLWTNALAYYVQHYHFRVPDEFVRHMQQRNWTPPPTGSLNNDELLARFYNTSR